MPCRRLADRPLSLPPPLAAGIVNVTADSFFEGARSQTPERAVEDGLALAEAGFDLLDVGAVATRSGAAVPASEEAARLVPAVEELARRAGVPVTADTFQPEVARQALDAGAAAVNDISGGADPGYSTWWPKRVAATSSCTSRARRAPIASRLGTATQSPT